MPLVAAVVDVSNSANDIADRATRIIIFATLNFTDDVTSDGNSPITVLYQRNQQKLVSAGIGVRYRAYTAYCMPMGMWPIFTWGHSVCAKKSEIVTVCVQQEHFNARAMGLHCSCMLCLISYKPAVKRFATRSFAAKSHKARSSRCRSIIIACIGNVHN